MFRTDDMIGLGPLYAPTALIIHGGRNGTPTLAVLPFWLGPDSTLRPARSNDASNKGSHTLAMPITLALHCLRLAVAPSPRGPSAPLKGIGYVVRVLRTVCYLTALPRRVPAMERQVASRTGATIIDATSRRTTLLGRSARLCCCCCRSRSSLDCRRYTPSWSCRLGSQRW